MKLQGKTILITGGASGIGLEAARQFLALGMKVIITGRNEDKLSAVKKFYPNLTAIQSDVANEADAENLYNKLVETGGIDILYNNAGVAVEPLNLGKPDTRHVKGAAQEMEINYLGAIRLNNLFMDMLKGREEGAIINTTSILSYVPSLLEATYSASKTALGFYTKTLREHLRIANSKVKVFELLPPLVATEMTASKNDKKISPEELIGELISGLEHDRYTIRVGDTKLLYWVNRLFPKLAFRLVNPDKNNTILQ